MKKKLQRLLSAVLTVCMLATFAPVAMAASDIDGHWAQPVMQEFIDQGWLSGYGNGQYGPDDPMTRAQFATLINQVAELTEESASISQYTDVNSSAWYYSDLAKALEAGYMSGTSATTMSPDAPITREQAVTMVASLLKLTATDAEVNALERFSDLSDVSGYAKTNFAAMVAAGHVAGMPDGRLMPQKQLTRAEGITILHSALDDLLASKDASTGTLKDGVYTGTGAGYGGTIKVQMTVSGGKITAIEVVSHKETNAYYNRAKVLIDTVLNRQTTDGVDTISGATKSSNGLLTAISACISQAQGGKDTSKTGATGSGGGGAGNSTPTEGEEFNRLADGVYEGSAVGYSGITNVKVTVSGGKISAVEIVSHGDTNSYFESAKEVIDWVISAQSTDVDTVSGATYSSYGILNAINNALKEAGSEDAVTIEVASWSEFTRALAAAQNGDTIKLTADITDAGEDYKTLTKDEDGSSYESLVDAVSSATLGMATISKGITIDGDGHSISAGADMAYCFYISGSGIVIQDLTIDGASYGARMGGGLYVAGEGASVAFDNVTFRNCVSYKTSMAGNGGGAIYAKGSVTVTAENCTFDSNLVNVGLGGAILVQGANVTLKDCAFNNNQAPYGGAIAANSTANITVTGCTFSGNDAAYGGDSIYIFEGTTNFGRYNGTSDVTFALSGNVYDADGENWTDYAVVLGRYYEDGAAEPGDKAVITAVGGHDLTFAAIARNEEPTENTDAPETLYGTATLTYAEFYAGDVSSTDDYGIDGVTSATVEKYNSFNGNMYTNYTEGTAGYNIFGVKNVNVAVPASDYEEFVKLNDSFVYTGSTAPSQYKPVTVTNGKAVYSATEFNLVDTVADAAATLKTGSAWGDYEIDVIETSTKYIRNGRSDEGFEINANVQGIILETSEGLKVGMEYLQSIWVQPWEVSFNISKDSQQNAHIVGWDNLTELAKLEGATITSITYIMPDSTYVYQFDGIYIKPVYRGENTITATFTEDSETVAIDGVPEALSDVSVTITYGSGRQSKTVADAVEIVNGKVTMDSAYDSSQPYTVKVSSSNYADIAASIFTPEPKTLYGTATLTYAEFYSGDVTSTDGYGIDGVTTATVEKYVSFNGNMYTNYTEDKTEGYNIYGVKNVNVAVSSEDYEAFAALNPSFELTGSTAPKQYKTVTIEDGKAVYSATTFNIADTVTDAAASLKTGSTWGDYEIDVKETSTAYIRNNRSDDGWAINANIQGIILETEDGFKTGMEYLQSIWVQPWEVSFNVSEDSGQNAHIAVWDNLSELAKLVGTKITSITYIMPDSTYIYQFGGIYIKPVYGGDAVITAAFTEGSDEVEITNVPDELENVTVTITYGSGRQSKTVADAVEIVNGKVIMDSAYDSTQTYTVKVSSSNYADIVAALPVTAAQKAEIEKLISEVKALQAAGTDLDGGLLEHYEEALDLIENISSYTSNDAAELIEELTEHLSVYSNS